MNIHAYISATLERLVRELVLDPKGASSIEKLKNRYHALIAENLLLLLVVGVHHISRGTMLSNTIIDCELKL